MSRTGQQVRAVIEAAAGLPCACCGEPGEYVGIYTRPGCTRIVGYGVCGSCDRDGVARIVEARVAHAEALALCTTTGGAA